MESAYHIVLILALALYLVSGYPIAPPPPPPPPPRRRQFKQNSAQLRVGASSPGPMMNADDHDCFVFSSYTIGLPVGVGYRPRLPSPEFPNPQSHALDRSFRL